MALFNTTDSTLKVLRLVIISINVKTQYNVFFLSVSMTGLRRTLVSGRQTVLRPPDVLVECEMYIPFLVSLHEFVDPRDVLYFPLKRVCGNNNYIYEDDRHFAEHPGIGRTLTRPVWERQSLRQRNNRVKAGVGLPTARGPHAPRQCFFFLGL